MQLSDGRHVHFRSANPEDAAKVLEYVEAVAGESDYLTFGAGEFELTVEQEAAFLQTCLDSANQLYLLALIDDVIVATATIGARSRPRIKHRGTLGMSVRRSFRGLGLGAAILEQATQWARANPVLTKLDLTVRTDNSRAVGLYRRRGFALEGTLRKQLFVDGVYHDSHAMGLDV